LGAARLRETLYFVPPENMSIMQGENDYSWNFADIFTLHFYAYSAEENLPGANLTIASYNARVVDIYNAGV
jgi:hypothetical protein